MEKYPDWISFQKWIESEEGGFLRIVDIGEHRCIIRYDKSSSLLNLPHVRWFRSVIWDKVNHYPISIAPPRVSEEPCLFTDDLVWEEHFDGFMIQCYRSEGDEEVGIATRSRRDASGTFYSSKSFRDLFLEAMGSFPKLDGPLKEKEEIAVYESYVVQHPEHRMVSPILRSRVLKIQRGRVYRDGRVAIEDHFPEMDLQKTDADVNGKISTHLLRIKELTDSGLQMNLIKDIIHQQPWMFRGLIAKDRSGRRWKFRSEKYGAIQSLRGNEANIYERYARVFSQNLSGVYLDYYPEDNALFSLCSVFIQHIVQTLYHMYRSVFIHKQTTFSQVNKMFHSHLYTIHGIYLSILRPSKGSITPQDIRMYLSQLPPARIAFLIRKQQDEYHSHISHESIFPTNYRA